MTPPPSLSGFQPFSFRVDVRKWCSEHILLLAIGLGSKWPIGNGRPKDGKIDTRNNMPLLQPVEITAPAKERV